MKIISILLMLILMTSGIGFSQIFGEEISIQDQPSYKIIVNETTYVNEDVNEEIMMNKVAIVTENATQEIIMNKNMSDNYQKSELDKLFEIMQKREQKQWREGDVLIASATTLAFFGFASFLTAQFRGKNQDKPDFLSYVDKVLIFIFLIQILQLVIMSIVVIGAFHWSIYFGTIIITGISLLIILINSRKIISLQNYGEIKMTEGTEMVKQAKEKYTHKMLRKAKEANKELEKLKKNKSE